MLSSTHYDEESQFLPIVKNLLKQIIGLKIIIAPRHPERSKSISDILSKNKIKNEIYKDLPKAFNGNEVIDGLLGRSFNSLDLYLYFVAQLVEIPPNTA